MRKSCIFVGLVLVFLCFGLSSEAWADSGRRVLWRISYDKNLDASERSAAETVVLRTLSRAEERHFASPELIKRKIEQEGLTMPSCFEDGSVCSRGGSFLAEVHNVDAYAEAKFSKLGNEWQLNLALYRRLGGEATRIEMSHTQLDRLVQSAIGSLFTLEATVNLSSQPNGAAVYLNSKFMGNTPLELKLVEGKQVIEFKMNGYHSDRWELNAQKGEVYPYDAKLVAQPTTFTMLTKAADATIYLNGEELGAANESYEVLPGEHEFVVKASGYEDFKQNIKIYPNHPQTAQAALLPVSEPWWIIRGRGIKRYRFSAYAGYQLLTTEMSLAKAKALSYSSAHDSEIAYYPQTMDANFHTLSFSPVIHSFVIGAGYEDEYWGAELFRLSLGGGGVDKEFNARYSGLTQETSIEILNIYADRLTHISFYPLQIKGHYTFNFIQVEATLGAGLSHIILHSKKGGLDYLFKQTAFSINLDLGLKYFFTQESFVKLSYVLQQDFEDGVDASNPRHGFALTFGMSPPWLMRNSHEEEANKLDVLPEEPAQKDSRNVRGGLGL